MTDFYPQFSENYPTHNDEVCRCENCHVHGFHDLQQKRWAAKGCDICQDDTEEIAFAVELKFTGKDLKKAETWAAKNRYRYEDTNHLLYDAFVAGQFEPENGFQEVINLGNAS